MTVVAPLLQREGKPHYIISLHHIIIIIVIAPPLQREGKPHYIISYHYMLL